MELASMAPASSSSVFQNPSELNSPQKPRTCGQCNQAEFKYTCPACSMRTCSLSCSNQHKVERRCSGKRNRTEYVKLNQYSWGQLMQDYTYLEEIHRFVSDARHSKSLKTNGNPASRQDRPTQNIISKRNYLVRKAALEGVQLILMAEGMARRKINMTNYNKKKSCLQWSLEIVFPSCEKNESSKATESGNPSSRQFSQLIHQVTSDTKLIEILKRTLTIKKSKLPKERKSMLLNLLEEQQKSNGGEDNFMFVMRIESFARSEESIAPCPLVEVHVLESNWKLIEALSGTKVLEWPKIEVWTTTEWTAQISSGQIKILPKSADAGQFQRPVDSGWSKKRIKIINSTVEEPVTIPEKELSSRDDSLSISTVDDNVEDQDADVESPSGLDNIQNSTLTMKSLLQYSSSEDESC